MLTTELAMGNVCARFVTQTSLLNRKQHYGVCRDLLGQDIVNNQDFLISVITFNES